MNEYTIPNTLVNQTKVRQAVAQFMVEKVLDQQTIKEMAMDYLEETFATAGHTIGDLAAMVKETEIPPLYHGAPPEPNHILCYGSYTHTDPVNGYYFFTSEDCPTKRDRGERAIEVRKAD